MVSCVQSRVASSECFELVKQEERRCSGRIAVANMLSVVPTSLTFQDFPVDVESHQNGRAADVVIPVLTSFYAFDTDRTYRQGGAL